MGNQKQEEFKIIHLILSFSLLGLIALLFIWIWQGKSTLKYVASLFDTENILLYVCISGGLGIIMSVIAVALVKWTRTKISGKENEPLKDLMKQKNGALLVGILPGIFEEILFRGFLLAFIYSFTNAVWAIIGTAIIFWLIHLPQYKKEIVLNFSVIMLSVVTSILFVETETLWAPIFAHIVYNYFVSLAVQKKIIEV